MATNYPGALDDFTNPTASDTLDSSTVPHHQQHADANDAIEAIEAELGTNPSGASATVKARLDSLDTTVAGKETPAGAQAKADAALAAAESYTDTVVSELNLADLADVDVPSPAAGEVLTFDGAVWSAEALPPGGVTSVDGRTGSVTLGDLYDPAGSAASAQTAAESYADGLAVNYDPAGSAATAETNAKDYADGLAVNYDPAGAAAAITLSGLGGVPTSRTVNGKALSADVTLSASDVGADAAGAAAAVTTTSIGAVPTSRTVNSKALSADITLSASDVGADPAGSAAAVTTTSIGAVPTSRTVNGYALSSNVFLTASDVGADPAGSAAAKVASVSGSSPITATGTTAVTVSIADGTTTAKGAVQLTDSTSSTSTTTAATPNSVKSAYDLASGKAATGTATPLVNGTAAAGTAAAASHEDHVHPTDTTRATALDEVIPTDPTGAYFSGSGFVMYATSGNYASAPSAAALNITGDIDIQVKATKANWTADLNALLSKYGAAGNRGYYFELLSGGNLRLYWSNDGTNLLSADSTAAVTFSANAVKWVRATLDVDNGASGNTTTFYTSDDGTNWTQLGNPVVKVGTTSIFATTAPLEIGSYTTGTRPFNGTIYRAIVKNGIGGTTVFDADFPAVPADSFAFTESSSNAATVTLTTTRYSFGNPGVALYGNTTAAIASNNDYMYPVRIRGKSITVKHLAFEVTTAPASAATVRLGIYAADVNQQPTGSPIFDSGAFTVSNSGAAIYRLRITPLTLAAGNYLLMFNTSVNFSVRVYQGGVTGVYNTLGTNLQARFSTARTNAAFPATPVPWTGAGIGGAASSYYNAVLLGWNA